MTDRREFIGAAAAFAAAPGTSLEDCRGQPLMRLGMLADLHLITRERGVGLQDSRGFEPALRYFDSRRADGVLVCGDLTDFGTLEELRLVGEIWDCVFPENRRSDGQPIKPLFLFGDHDMGGYMHKLPWAPVNCVDPETELKEIFSEQGTAEAWEECFHEKWAPIQVKELCGFPFVLAHHPKHTSASEHGDTIPNLAAFMARLNPDRRKPFFFVQHRVFRNTLGMPDLNCFDSGKTTAVLKDYPNVLAVCGHGHLSCADDLNLWQGAFTALQVPSVNFTVTRTGHENGCNNQDKGVLMPKADIRRSWQGMFGTMYADRFVVERLDMLNRAALAPEWVIHLPSPDGSASASARAARTPAPRFPAGAKLTVREQKAKNCQGKMVDQIVVSFPVAKSNGKAPRAYDYEVVARKGGRPVRTKLVFSRGQFWTEAKEAAQVTCAFAPADLPPDWRTSVRFAVAPRNAFGKRGPEISTVA